MNNVPATAPNTESAVAAREAARFDPSKRAEALLDSMLSSESPTELIKRELRTVAIEDAKRGRKILGTNSTRTMSRVLFVTSDLAYLEPNSSATNKLKFLGLLFEELHVLVVTPALTKEESKRIHDNIWIYRTGSRFWWLLPERGLGVAKEQLVFNDSFRPDIVVALDPLFSGYTAYLIARHFDRALQVQVDKDYFTAAYAEATPHAKWHRRLARHVLRRADSIRTSTSNQYDRLTRELKEPADLAVLPQFHNFSNLMNATPSIDLHHQYPDYVFIILTFAPLLLESPLQDVFTALHGVLRNPRIGLVVVGDGKAKSLYEEKAKLLGIEKNVVFLREAADLTSYLKTADVLIGTDTSKGSEEIVLQAAAAGLPMLLYETELRLDLFKDGESATLCPPGDTYALATEMNTFLNNPALRQQYKAASQYIVASRLQEDETTYYRSYRDSIELAIVNYLNATATE